MLLSASEIFQMAIRLEENGEKFYRQMAERMEKEEMKNLFHFLADEELRHRETFTAMLSELEDYQPSSAYPDEYFTYLRSYIDGAVFSRERLEKELQLLEKDVDVIDFAIRRELDTILFYTELSKFLPESQAEKVKRIIEEEKRHFLKLSNAKSALLGVEQV